MGSHKGEAVKINMNRIAIQSAAVNESLEPTRYNTIAIWFIRSVVLVLGITGLAKIWSAFGKTKFHAYYDPITGIQFGKLLLVVGVIEIAIAVGCCLNKRMLLSLSLVAWLGTAFFAYRVSLWSMGWSKPCSCLGDLTDSINLSSASADNIMKVVLAYLLAGSYGMLVWYWQVNRRAKRTEAG